MTKSTTTKPRPAKKVFKKKQTSAIHPYIECVQSEVSLLEKEILTLEELGTTRELTEQEKLDISIKNACLERYRATMDKLTEQSMTNKVHSHTSIIANEARQRETISFLQLMYLLRLGQLGLYPYIDQAPSLTSVANLCDQIIGAAVYYAKESSHHIKEQKRLKIQELLRKWDQSSNDIIDETVDQSTFKQIRDFLQHIWDNTKTVKGNLENEQNYAVLQFDGMISSENKNSNNNTLVTNNVSQVIPEASVSHTSAEINASEDTCDLSNHPTIEPDCVNSEPQRVATPPPTASTSDSNSLNTLDDNKSWNETSVNKDQSNNKENENSEWNKNAWEESPNSNNDNSNWENRSDKHDWRSIDNSVKGHSWNNSESQQDSNVIKDDSSTPPFNSGKTNDDLPETNSNDHQENWRRKDENNRGRGRGYRGRGRGKFVDRGRGRGFPRGRGRGRGREIDEDYNRHYEPTVTTTTTQSQQE